MKYLSFMLLGWILIAPVLHEGEEEDEGPPEEEVALILKIPRSALETR